MNMKETVIGIDCGTGFSCVAVYENNQAKIIENSEGTRTTPSVVAYTDSEILVGATAKRRMVTEPKTTLYEVKRLIGRKFTDQEIQKTSTLVPYDIIEAENGDAWVKVNDRKLAPQQVSAEVLRKMKKTAEDYLGYPVAKAVITVPAYFNDAQRSATKDAGRIAGLDVLRIINEPTAAVLAHGVDKSDKKDIKVLVADVGSGTTDFSVIEIINVETEKQFEVLSTNGDSMLGGTDWDQSIMDYIIAEFKREQGFDLKNDVIALQRLKEASEKAKIELSSSTQTTVSLPYITADAAGPKHLNINLTRAKFESITDHLIERIMIPCRTALADAKLSVNDIDEVLLVGGQTRMPKIQEVLEQFFKKPLRKDINPDEAVAAGAAIQGAVLAGNKTDILLLDVTPLSIGIETMGGVMTKLIEKNTTIPTKASQVFSTAEDNQSQVTVKISQGERELFKFNKMLGEFNLEGIRPAPRGVPQIEIGIDIDASGIMHVTAKDKDTGKENKITIKSDSGLSEADIKRMILEAEENAESDRKLKKLIDTKNQAESQIHMIRKDLTELKDQLATSEVENINNAISAVEAECANEDPEAITQAVTKLFEQATPLFIKKQEAEQNSSATPESNDNVVDAEFTEAT